MNLQLKLGLVLLAATLSVASFGADSPELGGNGPSQCAADVIKAFAGTDGAFLAAGQLKPSSDKDNLASLLQFPTEIVVVLNLTGAQLKQAFEHSVSVYPQPNKSFLQISGFVVTFSKDAEPLSRVTSVTVNGANLDEAKTYTVAMPSSLARGSLGFFRVWDKIKPTKSFDGQTLESVLKGKPSSPSPSRWLVQAH